MLQNKPSFCSKQPGIEDPVRNKIYALHFVWRVCKNDIKPVRCVFYVSERICSDHLNLHHPKPGNRILDEFSITPVHLNQCNLVGTTRCKFQCNTSCPGKKVQHPDLREIKIISQDIEQAFFCCISSRSGFKIPGNGNDPGFIFTADYSQ